MRLSNKTFEQDFRNCPKIISKDNISNNRQKLSRYSVFVEECVNSCFKPEEVLMGDATTRARLRISWYDDSVLSNPCDSFAVGAYLVIRCLQILVIHKHICVFECICTNIANRSQILLMLINLIFF